MALKLRKIKGLIGTPICKYADAYPLNDNGRFGKGIQDMMDDLYPIITNGSNKLAGPDLMHIGPYGMDIKAREQGRLSTSYSTIVSVSDHDARCSFDNLPSEHQNKILSDRLWVEHNRIKVVGYEPIYHDDFTRTHLKIIWNILSDKISRQKTRKSVSYGGYVMEAKAHGGWEFRKTNKSVEYSNRVQRDKGFAARFNEMFDTQV